MFSHHDRGFTIGNDNYLRVYSSQLSEHFEQSVLPLDLFQQDVIMISEFGNGKDGLIHSLMEL